MASGREDLFARIAVELAAIDGTGSYTNTIRYVSRDIVAFDAIPMFPAIIMIEETEEDRGTATPRELFLSAKLMMLLYMPQTPGTPASTTLNTGVRDVKLCMFTDRTHNATCHTTHYQGMDPLAVAGETYCGVVLNWGFPYEHTWGDP